MAATTRERHIWVGVFNELLDKAMAMFNAQVNAQMSKGKQLDPTRIRAEIPLITQEHFDRLEKVYIPAALGGIVSKEFVASQIPGVDMEEEELRRKEREAQDAIKAKEEMAMLKEEANAQTKTNAKVQEE
jgi:hypothetical protein